MAKPNNFKPLRDSRNIPMEATPRIEQQQQFREALWLLKFAANR